MGANNSKDEQTKDEQTKVVSFKDIKIKEGYARTQPSKEKWNKKVKEVITEGIKMNLGAFIKEIEINENNELVDGYINHLLISKFLNYVKAREDFIDDLEIRVTVKADNKSVVESNKARKQSENEPKSNYRTEPTLYVWGVHLDSMEQPRKEYVWRVPKGLMVYKDHIKEGAYIECVSKVKNEKIKSKIKVTKTVILNEPPISRTIRKVKSVILNPENVEM